MITSYYPPDPNYIVAPKGWSLCDGTNGTPDLRGRFVRGYSFKHENRNKFGKAYGKDIKEPQNVNGNKEDGWGGWSDRQRAKQ